jgi:hypothetical protein
MALSKRTLLLLAVSSCMVILACCQDAAAATTAAAASTTAEPAKYHDKKDKYDDKKDKYDDKKDKYESKHDKVSAQGTFCHLTTAPAKNAASRITATHAVKSTTSTQWKQYECASLRSQLVHPQQHWGSHPMTAACILHHAAHSGAVNMVLHCCHDDISETFHLRCMHSVLAVAWCGSLAVEFQPPFWCTLQTCPSLF